MSLLPLPCAVRRGFAFVFGLLLVSVAPGLRAQSGSPSAIDGFNPNVTGAVQVVVRQPDGKLIIGGSFVTINPNNGINPSQVSGLARLNLDGTIDSSFLVPSLTNPSNPALPSQVQCVVLQPDGKILVGGTTQIANGQKYLFRLNANGSQDTSFAPVITGTVNGAVTAVTYDTTSGNILIGGNFTSVNGSARNHVARLTSTGAVDAWNPNVNAQVDAITVETGTPWILLGGAFVNIGGGTTPTIRNHIARVNASTGAVDTSFDPNADNQVNQIVLQADGQILIGGAFNTLLPLQPDGSLPAASSTATFISRLNPNGTIDGTFTTQLGAPISQIIIAPTGQIYVCGSVGTVTSGGSNTLVQSNVARMNPDGSPDATFTPAVNGAVNGMALQPDGKLVIGGIFTQVASSAARNGTPRFGVARLDPSGFLDADFNPNAFGGIGVIAQAADGSYYVGGSFTSIGGVTVRNFAHILKNGAVDTAFLNPNPDLPVTAIALKSDGKIVIGGSFTQLTSNDLQPDGVNREGDITWYYLARLNADGSLDKTWYPYPDGKVTSLLFQPDGNLLVGGSFSAFTPNNNTSNPVILSNIARVKTDGSVDTSFEPNPDAEVDAMTFDSTVSPRYVIVGGNITSVTPASDNITSLVTGLAKLNLTDGRIDTTWEPNPGAGGGGATIFNLVLQPDGKILVGGVFASLTPVQTPFDPLTHLQAPVERHSLARINVDGTIDTSFNPDPDGAVYSVALNGTTGQILVGGRFTNINGQRQPFFAVLDSKGSRVPAFSSSLNGPVNAAVFQTNGQFIIGGAFTQITAPGGAPAQANHLARFNADDTPDPTFNLTGTVGTGNVALAAGVNAIALESDGRVIVAGNFANIAGSFASNIARFWDDGSFDSTFAADANGTVNSVVVESGGSSIYVGGSFDNIGGNLAYNIARINADGTADETFNANANVQGGTGVWAIAPQTDGNLFIAGSFTNVDGANPTNGFHHINVARLHGNGTLDTSFNAGTDGPVYTAVVLPGTAGLQQILIGGKFTALSNNGTGTGLRTNLARLKADGSLDLTFNANLAGGQVNAIAVQSDGNIVIGGSFTSVNGVAQANLARLTPTGALDPTFNIAVNGAVNAVVLENGTTGAAANPDSILLGGAFTTVGGQARNHAARLVASGSALIVDPGYNPNADQAVNAIAVSMDGKTYLGGSFSSVGGVSRSGIARLSSTGVSSSVITANPTFDQFTWTLTGEVPELNNVIFQTSSDGTNYTTVGAGARSGTGNVWTIANVFSVPNGNFYIRALADAETTEFGSQSEVLAQQHFFGTPRAVIQSSQTATAVLGQSFYYELAATNSPTSYVITGLPPGLAYNAGLGIISGTPTATGTSTVNVTINNANATAGTAQIILTVAPSSAGAATAPATRLLNLSARATVSTSTVLVEGLTIGGTGSKNVLLRAIGPGLSTFASAADLSAEVQEPILTLYNSGSNPVLQAQGWDNTQAMRNVTAMVGAFPISAGKDTSVATVLNPGKATFWVTTGAGDTGVALAEVYDADPNPYAATARLTNLSSRGLVDGTGDQLFGGFVIGGPAGSTKQVLIRGIGPGLAAFGIASPLPDPKLTVYSGSTVIASNSEWDTPSTVNSKYPAATAAQISAANTATGAFSLTAAQTDTAVLLTLAPGAYTVQITTPGANSGNAMVEIYDADAGP